MRADINDILAKARSGEFGPDGPKFFSEYLEAVSRYVEEVYKQVLFGVAIKLGVDPKAVQRRERRFMVSAKDLEKAGECELHRNDLVKALFDRLRAKYTLDKPFYKKFNLNRGKPLEPMVIKGRFVYNPETGKPITGAEWDELNGAVTEFLGAHADIGDEAIVRAAMLGKLMQKMREDGYKRGEVRAATWGEVVDEYGEPPKDLGDADGDWRVESQERNAIEYAQQHAGEFLSIKDGELKRKIVKMVRDQITEGLREGLSAQRLVQRLFWIDPSDVLGRRFEGQTLEAINRDWRRIALTELSFAFNNGYLLANLEAAEPGEDLYMIYMGRYNPKEKPNRPCNKWLGEVVRLVPKPLPSDAIKDKYARYAVWPGKNAVGNDWIAIPSHPHCSHFWEKIYPEREEYDREMGKVVFKEAPAEDAVEKSMRRRGE